MNKKILPVIAIISIFAIMSFGVCLDNDNEADAADTYTLTFQSNNSNYGTVSTSTLTVPAGSVITIHGNTLEVDSRTVYANPHSSSSQYTYRFNSWSVYTYSTVNSDMTITANFSRETNHYPTTIYYNDHATQRLLGEEGFVRYPSSTYELYYAEAVTIIATIDYGYNFVKYSGMNVTEGEGWDMLPSSPEITINGQTVRCDTWAYGEEEYTLYVSAATPTVTFDATTNGGTLVGASSKTVTFNSTYGTMPTATKTNSTFLGWFDAPTGGERITADDYVDIASNHTLYAQFSAGSYTLTFQSNNSNYGTVSTSTLTVAANSQISISSNYLTVDGNTVTATKHADSTQYSYRFTGWSVANGTRVLSDMTITANFQRVLNESPLTIYYNSHATQRISGEIYDVLPPNTSYEYNYGDAFTLTAVIDDGYAFVRYDGFNVVEGEGWSFTEGDEQISVSGQTVVLNSEVYGDTTYTLVVEPVGYTAGATYWSNNLYNGSVTLAFKFNGGNNNMSHTMDIPLYTGQVRDNETEWSFTGYSLEIGLSYPKTTVYAALKMGDTVIGHPVQIEIGQWPSFIVKIDADNGILTFTPINRFNDFTSFTLYSNRESVIIDWSDTLKGAAIYMIAHTDTGSGAHPSFAVTSTDTFLNTYGVVMTNPSINVSDFFPDYTNVRLNFYSFALYGSSMTINGDTLPVEEGKVTVWFTRNNNENLWATPNTEGAMSKTFTLSNIYVTWESGVCTLTFVNENFTVNLGSYSAQNKTVSFTGFWYFSSYLYEPYTVTEAEITGDWKELPDIGGPAMILVFMGILILGGLVAHIKLGLKWLDMVVVTIAAVLAFILLG